MSVFVYKIRGDYIFYHFIINQFAIYANCISADGGTVLDNETAAY